ncbi:MAG: hypothetical protein MZV64_00420 [Ignavibacteriales bacterium]|nr:hypothetical protein [Ignavibacteriales bacterium]
MRIGGEESAHLLEKRVILVNGLAAPKIEDALAEVFQHPPDRVGFEGFPVTVQSPKTILHELLPGGPPVIADLIKVMPAQQVHGTMREHGSHVEQFGNGALAGTDRTDEQDLGIHITDVIIIDKSFCQTIVP